MLLNSIASSLSFTTMSLLFASDRSAVALRGIIFNCESISCRTSAKIFSDVVIRTTCESVPCSACDSRSAAIKTGLLVSSAMTHTSDGPAGMSMAAS